jgi:hypothetical protein
VHYDLSYSSRKDLKSTLVATTSRGVSYTGRRTIKKTLPITQASCGVALARGPILLPVLEIKKIIIPVWFRLHLGSPKPFGTDFAKKSKSSRNLHAVALPGDFYVKPAKDTILNAFSPTLFVMNLLPVFDSLVEDIRCSFFPLSLPRTGGWIHTWKGTILVKSLVTEYLDAPKLFPVIPRNIFWMIIVILGRNNVYSRVLSLLF